MRIPRHLAPVVMCDLVASDLPRPWIREMYSAHPPESFTLSSKVATLSELASAVCNAAKISMLHRRISLIQLLVFVP